MIRLISFMVRFRSHDSSDSRFFPRFLNEGKELVVFRHQGFFGSFGCFCCCLFVLGGVVFCWGLFWFFFEEAW